ncbi:MAG: O-antigen ligase family protein [bacterium]|nr:O-antigen ligase family protein [bacterium]
MEAAFLRLGIFLIAVIITAIYIFKSAFFTHTHPLILALLALLAGEVGAIKIAGQSGKILYADLVLFLFLVSILIRYISSKKSIIPRTSLDIPIMVFIYINIFSVYNSIDFMTSISELKELVVGFVVFWLVVWAVREEGDIKRLFLSLATFGFLMAVYLFLVTILQGSGFLDAVAARKIDLPWGRSNYLATFWDLIIPVTIGLFINARRFISRISFGTAIFIMLAGLLITLSKGGIGSLILALILGISIFFRSQKKVIYFITPLLIVILAIIYYEPLNRAVYQPFSEIIGYRFSKGAMDYSVGERMKLYNIGFQVFTEHPVIGCGINNFEVMVGQIFGIEFVPHNIFLGTAAETGTIGLLALGWLFVAIFLKFVDLIRNIADEYWQGILKWTFIGVMATLIHEQVETNLIGSQFKIVFWFTIGIIYAMPRVILLRNADCRLRIAE